MENITWSALEYEEKERSKDWFWALCVIIVTSSIASIIFGNYFFATLLLLGGLMLGFFAIKKPDMIHYELNEKGLAMGGRLYLYENIKSFWVQTKEKIIFFVKTERMFMPVFSIPIDIDLAEDIRFIMLSKNVEEEEMKEHPSIKIMESLGF